MFGVMSNASQRITKGKGSLLESQRCAQSPGNWTTSLGEKSRLHHNWGSETTALVNGNNSRVGKLLEMSAEQGNDEQDDHDSNDGNQDEPQNLLLLPLPIPIVRNSWFLRQAFLDSD